MDQHSLALYELAPKTQIVKSLSESIPINPLGLPTYLYRSDFIPLDLNDKSMEPADRITYLNNAIVELDYSQGFPTIGNGEPFWGQLAHEHAGAYRAFTQYLYLSEDNSVRQLHEVKLMVPEEANNLLDYYHVYYWAARVKAYDYFHAAEHEKRKQLRFRKLEDTHFEQATAFVEQCQALLASRLVGDAEDVKTKDIMDFITKMMQMQRVAVGATAFGAGNAPVIQNAAPAASMEVTLRTIAEQSGANTEMKTVSSEDPTKALLRDPEALAQAQELIIRMQTTANPRVNPHSGAELLRLEGGVEQFAR